MRENFKEKEEGWVSCMIIYSVCALSRAKILTFWSISKESTCNIVESIVMKQLYTDIWYVPVYRFKNNKPCIESG